jgi:serine/threonine protein kinase
MSLANIINSQIGRYQIFERLGSGGMATVFRAEDTTLRRSVAIKILRESLSFEPTFTERFKQEAQLIASLNHPNIVQVYDFDVIERNNEKMVYMVMPYIVGKTLASVLEDLRYEQSMLAQERVRDIMLDLCSALSYAHVRGMVHRDVKPSNILFDENNKAILTDFGIAKLAQQQRGLTQDGTIVGTPAYMSPEQATGEAIDGRSDIYALGIILFEMLTGRTPFEDDGTVSVLLKHVQTPPPNVTEFVPHISPYFDALVAHALAKNPHDRYQTADEFATDIRAVFKGKPSTRQMTISGLAINEKIPSATRQVPLDGLAKGASAQIRPTTRILRTINTSIIKPAQQNPLTFVSIGIALLALLLVARFSNATLQPTTITPTVQPNELVADSMTSTELFGISNFDKADPMNGEWQQNADGMVSRMIVDGKYELNNIMADTASVTLFNPMHIYQNVRITMDAKLLDNSAENSGYGVIFRYQDNDNYNVFAVDGASRFSLWTRENGQWRELRDAESNWSESRVIQPIGRSNIITLNVYEDSISGYVNGTRLVFMTDTTFSEGAVGIYMATPSDGQANVSVETYTISQADNPVQSMTADSQAESMTEGSVPSMTNELTPEATTAQ